MTFKQWLRAHKDDDNGLGDFARQVCADKSFSRSKDYAKVLLYLEEKQHLDEHGIQRFKETWKLYAGDISSDTEDYFED